MALNKKASSKISANGGKCPTGVKFMTYSNPHGDGLPMAYDDTDTGIDTNIKVTMAQVKKAFKPSNP
jgi:hypothetical protein